MNRIVHILVHGFVILAFLDWSWMLVHWSYMLVQDYFQAIHKEEVFVHIIDSIQAWVNEGKSQRLMHTCALDCCIPMHDQI